MITVKSFRRAVPARPVQRWVVTDSTTYTAVSPWFMNHAVARQWMRAQGMLGGLGKHYELVRLD